MMPARRWPLTPVLAASLLLHAAALAALLIEPRWWPAAAGAVLCNHAALAVAVMLPRASFIGSNLTCLPAAAAARGAVSLTFDDGPDPAVTPQVLDLLDRYDAKASFFCIGARAAAHPALVAEIVRRGHSVENHSFSHPHAFSFYGWRALAREVDTAQDAIAAAGGRRPQFFRAPAGFRSPLLEPILARRGLRYVSWTRRGFDTRARNAAAVLRRLTRRIAAGDVLLLHDRKGRERGEALVLTVLSALLPLLRERGLASVSLPAAFSDEPRT